MGKAVARGMPGVIGPPVGGSAQRDDPAYEEGGARARNEEGARESMRLAARGEGDVVTHHDNADRRPGPVGRIQPQASPVSRPCFRKTYELCGESNEDLRRR